MYLSFKMFFLLSDRELLTSRVFDQRQLMIQCMTFNPTGDLLGWLSDYLQHVIFLCEDVIFFVKAYLVFNWSLNNNV